MAREGGQRMDKREQNYRTWDRQLPEMRLLLGGA